MVIKNSFYYDIFDIIRGIARVNALYSVQFKEGHHNLALKLAQNTSYPSSDYMFHNDIQNSITTWETWDILPKSARPSFNHHMFNSIGAWFYRYLSGIEQTIPTYPHMSYDGHLLTHVKAEMVTIKGSVHQVYHKMC